MILSDAQNYHAAERNRPAYILGNGESLRQAGPLPRGGTVIGVNRSWTLYPDTDHWVFSGGALHARELVAVAHRPKVAWTWDSFPSETPLQRLRVQTGELVLVRKLEDDGRRTFRANLATGTNAWFAGLLAIHVATWLGANPIYLLGFDSTGGHHYPDARRVDRTDFIPYYRPVKEWASRNGVRIVNCSASSSIRDFELGTPGG